MLGDVKAVRRPQKWSTLRPSGYIRRRYQFFVMNPRQFLKNKHNFFPTLNSLVKRLNIFLSSSDLWQKIKCSRSRNATSQRQVEFVSLPNTTNRKQKGIFDNGSGMDLNVTGCAAAANTISIINISWGF